jgi:O-antigen/teichoic acid export membrane protein
VSISARRIARESAVYATAGVLGKAIALLSVPVLTRLLDAGGYGLADLAASLAATLALVGRFGGEVPAARAASEAWSVAERRRVLGTFVLVTAAVSSILAVILVPAIPLITALWSAPDQDLLAGAALLLVPIGAVQVALVSVVRLEGRPTTVAALATIDLLAQAALAVLLVILGFGPLGVIFGYVVGSAIGLAAAALASRPFISLRFSAARGIRMLTDGIPYLPAFTAFVFSDQIARFSTADTLGPLAVGHLAVGIRIASVMTLAVSAFSFAWAPAALGMPRSAKTAAILQRALVWYMLIGLLASTAIGAWAPEIVQIVAGTAFRTAAIPTPGLAWAAALSGAFFILMTVAGVTQRGRPVAAAAFSGAAIQIVLALVLVEWIGLAGIGVAAVSGRLVGLALLGFAVRDFLSAWGWRFSLLAIGGSAAVMAIQGMNAGADEALPARLVVGTTTALLAALISFRLLAPRWRAWSGPESEGRCT